MSLPPQLHLSVVLPTYNRPTYFPKVLTSLSKQFDHNFELVVCDDASTVKYAEPMLKNLRHPDSLTKLIVQQENLGEVLNVYTGMFVATGDYVYVIHDDDTLIDSAVFSEVMYFLDKYQPTLLVCGHQVTTTKGTTPILLPFDGWFTQDFQRMILDSNPTIMGGFFVKKSALDEVGYLDGRYKYYSDWDLLIRLSTLDNFTAYYMRRVIINYNIHQSSQTQRREAEPQQKETEQKYIDELVSQIKLVMTTTDIANLNIVSEIKSDECTEINE